jgi:hypothetical protein
MAFRSVLLRLVAATTLVGVTAIILPVVIGA